LELRNPHLAATAKELYIAGEFSKLSRGPSLRVEVTLFCIG
jgi:hypothetical protein